MRSRRCFSIVLWLTVPLDSAGGKKHRKQSDRSDRMRPFENERRRELQHQAQAPHETHLWRRPAGKLPGFGARRRRTRCATVLSWAIGAPQPAAGVSRCRTRRSVVGSLAGLAPSASKRPQLLLTMGPLLPQTGWLLLASWSPARCCHWAHPRCCCWWGPPDRRTWSLRGAPPQSHRGGAAQDCRAAPQARPGPTGRSHQTRDPPAAF
jgi:hypothetical protein